MATKTSTTNSKIQSSLSQKEQSPPPSTEVGVESVTVPPAGRALSFEEAKAWALKKYDSAFRELAK